MTTTMTTTTTTTGNERMVVASLLHCARYAHGAARTEAAWALGRYRQAMAERNVDAAMRAAAEHDVAMHKARIAAGWVNVRAAVLASFPVRLPALRGARAIIAANAARRAVTC